MPLSFPDQITVFTETGRNDSADLGPEQRHALTEAFALAAIEQAPAEPRDWLSNTCPTRWFCGDYGWDAFMGSAFPCPS